jgi:hypothetical protein
MITLVMLAAYAARGQKTSRPQTFPRDLAYSKHQETSAVPPIGISPRLSIAANSGTAGRFSQGSVAKPTPKAPLTGSALRTVTAREPSALKSFRARYSPRRAADDLAAPAALNGTGSCHRSRSSALGAVVEHVYSSVLELHNSGRGGGWARVPRCSSPTPASDKANWLVAGRRRPVAGFVARARPLCGLAAPNYQLGNERSEQA